jgi:hypothetical protein
MTFSIILIMYGLGGLLGMWGCDIIAVWFLFGLSLIESLSY